MIIPCQVVSVNRLRGVGWKDMRCHVPKFRDATARVPPESIDRQVQLGPSGEFWGHSDANYFATASAFLSAVALASASLYEARSIA